MLVYISLDTWSMFLKSDGTPNTLFRREISKRTLIAASLFLPSLAEYCSIVYFREWEFLTEFHHFFSNCQIISIITALLCSLFDHRIDDKNKVGNLQPNFIEKHTVSILFSFNLGNIITFFSIIHGGSRSSDPIMYFSGLFFTVG